MAAPKPAVPGQADVLMAELRGLIESAPSHVTQIVNTTLTMLQGNRVKGIVLIHAALNTQATT